MRYAVAGDFDGWQRDRATGEATKILFKGE